MIGRINSLFPLWALLFSITAYMMPQVFTPYKAQIAPLLIAIMFFMGVTLRLEDFARVLKQPKIIAITVALQFFIMPLAAFLLSKLFGFSTELLVGMILVGAVSGGTASNVITYLAKGDVALSITMTMTSTLLSVFATPFFNVDLCRAKCSCSSTKYVTRHFTNGGCACYLWCRCQLLFTCND